MSRSFRFLTASVLAASLSLGAGSAHSQPADDVSVADQLYKRSSQALKQGKLAEAREALKALWAIEQTARVACDYGYVASIEKDWSSAARMLERCVELAGKKAGPRIQKQRAEALSHVHRLELNVSPTPFKLTLGGELLEETVLYLEPGTHQLVFSASGHEDEQLELVAEAGKAEVRSVTLEKYSAAPVPAPVAAPPPPEPAPVEPASPQGNPYALRNTVVITGAVLATGALITSFVFRANASSKSNQIDSLRTGMTSSCAGSTEPRCLDLAELEDNRQTDASNANVFLGVGIGLMAATAVAFVLWPKPEPRGPRAVQANLHLNLSRSSSSLIFQGEF